MWRTPLPSSASYSGMIAPPGYPNTRSTPSARRHCRTMSAPLSIRHLLGGVLGCICRLLTFLGQPAHHAAQLRADDLNGMLLFFLAQSVELVAAALVLRNPFPRELAALNVGQRLLHGGARGIAHNLLSARQIAVFRRIRDGMAHAAQAAFVDQIHDQLHLVQALEVGNLRRVAGLDQGFEAFLDQ